MLNTSAVVRQSKKIADKIVIIEINTQKDPGFRPFTSTVSLDASDRNICWVLPVNRSVVGIVSLTSNVSRTGEDLMTWPYVQTVQRHGRN